MNPPKSPTRGGARPGSGRPKAADPARNVTVRLALVDRALLDDLAEERGESRAAVVRVALRALADSGPEVPDTSTTR